jgi:hypothetical protein
MFRTILIPHTTYSDSDTITSDAVATHCVGVNNLHTFEVNLKSFIGKLCIQGTLSQNPSSDDWAELQDTVIELSQPSDIHRIINNSGSYTYLRAQITDFSAGTIRRVVYNS